MSAPGPRWVVYKAASYGDELASVHDTMAAAVAAATKHASAFVRYWTRFHVRAWMRERGLVDERQAA